MSGVLQQAKMAVAGEVAGKISGPPHWHDGVCSCGDDTNICLQTFCCFPCTASNIFNKRETGFAQFDCFTCICFLAGWYATNGRYATWVSMGLRRELIQRYGIQNEAQCNSCLLGMCCAPCTYCQVQREMGKRNEHAGGFCAEAPSESPSMGDRAMGAIASAINTGGSSAIPKPWTTGVCGCNCMECLEGVFCGCCVLGFMGTKLNSSRMNNVDGSVNVMDPVSCCGALWYPQGWRYMARREIIERYNIAGESHLMTLIMSLCCPFCSVLQLRREMGHGGEWPGGLCVKDMPQ